MAQDARTNTGRHVALGGGVRVPYPAPTSTAASKVGRANKRTGTGCEMALRSALHAAGFRYRTDFLLRVGDIRVRPDIVFTRVKVAVFVDGCFWHGCPVHGTTPKANQSYWAPKLERNRQRDRHVDRLLTLHGWLVIRLWEHEDPLGGARKVAELVRHRRQARGGSA